MIERTRYVYKTTCLVTGHYYVGMHSTRRPNVVYYGSGVRLKRSLQKHGRDNHRIEILSHAKSEDELRSLEREAITETVLQDPLCMNIMMGGEGGFSEGVRNKSHQAFRTKLQTDEKFRDRISAMNVERAKMVSSEGRRNCSAALKDRYKDPAFKAKQVAGAKDRYLLMKQAQMKKIEAGWVLLKDPTNTKRRKLFPPEQLQQMLDDNWTLWEVK